MVKGPEVVVPGVAEAVKPVGVPAVGEARPNAVQAESGMPKVEAPRPTAPVAQEKRPVK